MPTKDGGEGFGYVLKCIQENIKYAQKEIPEIFTEVHILINGDPKKPDSFSKELFLDVNIYVHYFDFFGKVKSINTFLKIITFLRSF
jgi:hypothetical protein